MIAICLGRWQSHRHRQVRQRLCCRIDLVGKLPCHTGGFPED